MMQLKKFTVLLIFLMLVAGIPDAFSQTTDKAKLMQFEDAITKGEEYLQAKDYAKAKAEYQKALAIDPTAKYPKDKLAQIRKVYTDPKDEADFRDAVAKGDQLMGQGDYKGAKEQYAAALLIKPDDKAVKEKSTNADKALTENNRKLQQYTAMIRKADSLYNLKDYEGALEMYRQAQILEAPSARIREIETMLAEKKALEDSYTAAIDAGDQAYMGRDFVNAQTQYEKASRLKPTEGYPKSMLEKVREAMAKQATEQVSESELAARKRAEDERLKAEQAEKERLALEAKEKADREERDRIALKEKEEQDRLLRQTVIQENLNNAEKLRLAAVNKEQALIDSLNQAKIEANKLEEQKLAEAKKAEDDKKAEAQKKEDDKLAEAKKAEDDKIVEAKKAEENIRIAEAQKAEQDSIAVAKKAEEDKIAEAKKQEDDRLAEIKREEEEEAHRVMLANASETDKQYYAALESGNTYYTLEDYPSALHMFEIAAQLKPGEEYARDRVITVSNIMKERLKNNLDPYYKLISTADVYFQANMFDRALEEYQNASANRPDENYPIMMIERIRKLMEDNSMVNLSESPVVFNETEEKRYQFKPISLNQRRNNYLIIRAKYTSEKPPKIFINYGKDDQKSGGFVIKMQEGPNTTDYLLRLSNQDKWYRLENNWITFYPEGGSIEVESLRITQGDVPVIK